MPNRRHHGFHLRRHSARFYLRNIFVALTFFLISCDSEPSKDTALNVCEEDSETQKEYNLCVCTVKLVDESEDPHLAKMFFSLMAELNKKGTGSVFINRQWMENYAKENGISKMELKDAGLDLQKAVISCNSGIDIR